MEAYGGVWKEHNPITKTVQAQWKEYHQTLSFTLPALGASIWKVKRRQKTRKCKNNSPLFIINVGLRDEEKKESLSKSLFDILGDVSHERISK